MLYEQQLAALTQQLHGELRRLFAVHSPAVEVAIDGRGVDWGCIVRTRQRSCRIGCYIYKAVTRCCIDFADAAGRIGRGWADLSSDVHAAAQAWIAGTEYVDLAQQFPWLSAVHIEGEFLRTWDLVECHYVRLQEDFSPVALSFIVALRQAGYDRSLRAGSSMWTLVVSRSRHHGLRGWQPCIRFDFDADFTMTATVINATQRVSSRLPAMLIPETAALLAQLASQDITTWEQCFSSAPTG